MVAFSTFMPVFVVLLSTFCPTFLNPAGARFVSAATSSASASGGPTHGARLLFRPLNDEADLNASVKLADSVHGNDEPKHGLDGDTAASLTLLLKNLYDVAANGNHFPLHIPTMTELHDTLKNVVSNGSISQACINDTMRYFADLAKRRPYALQMFDATAKVPAGILHLNLHWVGSYDECLNTTAVHNESGIMKTSFHGRYCSAVLPVNMIPGLPMQMTYGMCVPDSCDNSSIAEFIQTVFSLIKYKGHLTGVDCSGPKPYDVAAIVSLVIISFLVALVILGTCFDLYRRNSSFLHLTTPINQNDNSLEEQMGLLRTNQPGDMHIVAKRELNTFDKVLLSFSAVSNAEKILSTDVPRSNITMLHGLRVLSMWWVIMGHTYFMQFGNIDNGLDMLAAVTKWLYSTVFRATFSVDTFFFLSGLLVTYLSLREMKSKNGKLNWFLFYFHRFWRLTPTYMLCLMYFTNLVDYAAPGPGVYAGALGPVKACRTYWWTNLLYINNFVPINASLQCLSWTWYLANDMQFYVISPLILLPLFYKRKVGIAMIGILSLICIILRGFIVSYFGIVGIDTVGVPPVAPRNLYPDSKGFDYLYDKPYTRIQVYLAGMAVGFILYQTECKKVFNFKKIYVLIGWTIAFALGLSVVYGLAYDAKHQIQIGYDLQALYIALSRFAWSLALSWVVFACVHGMGGWINTFLSWKFWIPLSRLTYCAYLVHPLWMYTYIQYQRMPSHFDDISMLYLFFGNIVFSYFFAFLVSLLIEAPMIGLEKIVFKRRS